MARNLKTVWFTPKNLCILGAVTHSCFRCQMRMIWAKLFSKQRQRRNGTMSVTHALCPSAAQRPGLFPNGTQNLKQQRPGRAHKRHQVSLHPHASDWKSQRALSHSTKKTIHPRCQESDLQLQKTSLIRDQAANSFTSVVFNG